jgi:hypothetical protein
MLYVACGACRNANPLYCTGGFPMHLPMLAFQGRWGAMPVPVGRCCVVPVRVLRAAPDDVLSLAPAHVLSAIDVGQMQPLAPVVQAPAGVDENHLNSLFLEVRVRFVTSAASQFGKDFAGQ